MRRCRKAEDPALLEEIVRRFEPLARSVARRYHARGEPLEDLTQVAMVGLLKAIARFEPDRGFAFTSYATPTMLGELKRYFRDNGWAVHVPRRLQELRVELSKAKETLALRLDRDPTVTELAEHLGLPEEEVVGGTVVIRPPDGPRRHREQYELLRSRVLDSLAASTGQPRS